MDAGVAAATQNQALNAIHFLYRRVLGRDFPELKDLVRARKPQRLPVVLSRDEVQRVFDELAATQLCDASAAAGL